MERPLASGWSCAVCGKHVDIAEPLIWRCPNASDTDRHHALQLVQGIAPLRGTEDPNPFVAFRPFLAWDSFAAAHGMTETARTALVTEIDAEIATVAGTGFHVTPFERADALSDALGFGMDGGVWVKDETGQVAGSHKARHLFTILLHLRTAELLSLSPWSGTADRPPLAIASCGNAAYAAATLAAAATWPLRVFVPPSADPVVLARLAELHAEIVECPRLSTDPAGDPCIHRFREAVRDGAIPFTVQGIENMWCLDGGRTIGWEMAGQFEQQDVGPPLDRVFVQVGAGTFAASAIAGLRMSGVTPKLHAVQTDSCAPLERAHVKAMQMGGPQVAATHWSECMWPWEHVGTSAADGILDDETYDWIPVVRAMVEGHGSPIVAPESLVLEANALGRTTTGINASHTGTAGLAGLLAARETIGADERVAVIFSGVEQVHHMTDTGETRRKPKGATWESWVDRQIRDGIERGEFENLPGKGRPLEGIGGSESHHDEDWWLKAKLRRERLSYLPPTLAIRKELEEALEAVAIASREDVVRRIVDDINERIREVNRRGAEGPPSTVMPVDVDAVLAKWRRPEG